MYSFNANINIIGINPFVFVPEDILHQILKDAGKTKGHVPIKGLINKKPYKQTLVKYKGEWRLYVNTSMLKDSPKRIGERVDVTVSFDPESREIAMPEKLQKALQKNKKASSVYDNLRPSLKSEIIKYLVNLKTEESREINIKRAIGFLLGKERFIGRDKP